jgi:hypothetical protein
MENMDCGTQKTKYTEYEKRNTEHGKHGNRTKKSVKVLGDEKLLCYSVALDHCSH